MATLIAPSPQAAVIEINRQVVVDVDHDRRILEGGPSGRSEGIFEMYGVVSPPADDNDVELLEGRMLEGGIDYSAWTAPHRPAPREAFVDRLDLLELFDDD
jgi:hypothetical protein